MRFFELKKTKSPLELYDISNKGHDAKIAQKILSDVLAQEKDFLLAQIAGGEPDALRLAKLSGRLDTIVRLEKILSIKVMEGEEAREMIIGR